MIYRCDNNLDWTMFFASEGTLALTGYSPSDLEFNKTISFGALIHADDQQAMWTQCQAAIAARKPFHGEYRILHRNGEIRWVLDKAEGVYQADGTLLHIEGFIVDITEQKQAQQRVAYLATRDALTNLPNRKLLNDRLDQAISRASRQQEHIAVLYLDLDQFKLVNDSLGHEAGDAVLCEVARRLTQVIRHEDTVARLGGDEFVLLIPDIAGAVAATVVAEKIQRELLPPLDLAGHQLDMRASIGIALYPEDGLDSSALLKSADTAMYYAKNRGRNNVQFYTEHLNIVARQRHETLLQLRSAGKNNEFVLAYQPQYNLHDGTLIGVEALLRWHNPLLGQVPPAIFIPLAEAAGLIQEIGQWVMVNACEQIRQWRQRVPGLVMSINVSPLQFQRGNLSQQVEEALSQHDLQPDALELEITENILADPGSETLQALTTLQSMGVALAIDDFGTGYSSLAYLRRFPVQRLKIDQSFVRDVCVDPSDAAIVRTIIALARSLNLKTIAEGVETQEHADFLRQAGCDAVQGYFYKRPCSARELERELPPQQK